MLAGWVGRGRHSRHGIPVEHRVVTWAAMRWGCWGDGWYLVVQFVRGVGKWNICHNCGHCNRGLDWSNTRMCYVT